MQASAFFLDTDISRCFVAQLVVINFRKQGQNVVVYHLIIIHLKHRGYKDEDQARRCQERNKRALTTCEKNKNLFRRHSNVLRPSEIGRTEPLYMSHSHVATGEGGTWHSSGNVPIQIKSAKYGSLPSSRFHIIIIFLL